MFKKSTGTKPASTGNAAKPDPKPAPAPVPAAPKTQASTPTATPAPAGVSEVKPLSNQTPSTTRSFTHDDIARAAYFRWKNYGGDALQNWIAAEQELRSGSAT